MSHSLFSYIITNPSVFGQKGIVEFGQNILPSVAADSLAVGDGIPRSRLLPGFLA